MNATARVLHQRQWAMDKTWGISLSKRGLLLSSLIMAVMLSAIGLIYTQNLTRHLNSDLQAASVRHQQLQVEGGQLLLEQSTWARQQRLQRVATTQLGMQVPQHETIVRVR